MRTRPARIEPACPYCDNDHDPAITCRVIAEIGQQILPPPRPELKRKVTRITGPDGRTVAVKHVFTREE